MAIYLCSFFSLAFGEPRPRTHHCGLHALSICYYSYIIRPRTVSCVCSSGSALLLPESCRQLRGVVQPPGLNWVLLQRRPLISPLQLQAPSSLRCVRLHDDCVAVHVLCCRRLVYGMRTTGGRTGFASSDSDVGCCSLPCTDYRRSSAQRRPRHTSTAGLPPQDYGR